MKYLFLLYADENGFPAPDSPEAKAQLEAYGAFFNALLSFLIIAAVVFTYFRSKPRMMLTPRSPTRCARAEARSGSSRRAAAVSGTVRIRGHVV